MNYDESKGKQASPGETVERIKACLRDAGIHVTERMFAGDVEGTYFSRVTVDGLENVLGTNGKGMTAEYCSASGHAELMERLQNCAFQYCLPGELEIKIIEEAENDGSSIRVCGLKELMELDGGLTHDYIAREVEAMEGVPPMTAYMRVVSLLRLASPYFRDDRIPIHRVWDYKAKKYVWAPHVIMYTTAMSNGMAAGNTLEEAIVQGASEIFERYSQHTMIAEAVTPPDIPEDALAAVPGVYKVIQRIRATGKYDVYVKDASLGKGFPVVCGIVVDRKRQTFGVKFGSSPSFAIALERVFTEAMQGRTLEDFTGINRIGYNAAYEANPENLFNIDKVGFGVYPAALFGRVPDYPFVPWEDVKDSDNGTLARKMLDRLSEQSARLYVEDVSCLGFPSVFIYSEGFGTIRHFSLAAEVQKSRAAGIMCRIGSATDDELECVLSVCRAVRGSTLENNLASLYLSKPFAGEPKGGIYSLSLLAALINIKLKRYKDAERWLSGVPDNAETEDGRYFSALKSYVRAMKTGTDPQLLEACMQATVDDATRRQLQEDLCGEDMLGRIYGKCGRPDCEDCAAPCLQPEVNRLFGSILRALRDSGVMTSQLHKLFGED